MLNRDHHLARLQEESWDLIVIGGGATGLGTAVDAASRGYRTLLLEQNDFAKATSSRSTKLIHGGVRYLRQGNVSLVRESLHERGLLLRNAASYVRPLEFLVPTYSWRETMFYLAGLKAYDLLAGRLQIASSRRLNTREVIHRFPTINQQGLSGGVSYFDAQFDDARLVIGLAQTFARMNGAILNYMPVTELTKQNGKISGVVARDSETGQEYQLKSRGVINATGIFSDQLRKMDSPTESPRLRLSQGIHIVVDRSFFPSDSAIIIPETDDGRVLFLIPWHGSTVIGTTETPVELASLEPRAREGEVDYLIEHTKRYLNRVPTRGDIRSCFAGLRPLVKANPRAATSQLSRDHVIEVSESGMVSITGGKWTTFRKMGQDAVDAVLPVAGLAHKPSLTENMPIEDLTPPELSGVATHPVTHDCQFSEKLVRHAVQNEMARTVDDVLSRRTRLLMLNAQGAIESANQTATILACELGRPAEWIDQQVAEFTSIAEGYCVH